MAERGTGALRDQGGDAIAARSVSKIFGSGAAAVHALDNVSITIREGEFFTLLGPSGCGKTTLLRLIAGFEFPSAGEILLSGENIAALPPNKRPVNTVFQSYALFPHMSVAQNIAFGLEMLGRSKGEVRDTVADMLRLVRMEELKDRSTSQLSGGQQQRVALARALAPRPKVLLLDEPLSALDLKLRKQMQIELKRLQLETGITFIFVTHDQEEALTMSDRLAVMSAGRVLQVGTPREIYDRPSSRFVASFIGETNFLEGDLVECNAQSAQLRLSSGRQIEVGWRAGLPREGKVAAVVRPEHLDLRSADDGALSGEIENIVYLGTDTHYHIACNGGEAIIVRQQNSHRGADQWNKGDRVGISIGANIAELLEER